MILITAATGQVGGRAATDLIAAGHRVRALVRKPAAAPELDGAEVVRGSFDDDASLARALAGVDTLFLAGRDSPESVDQQRHVLAHAAREGVSHIVKLSAIGARADSEVALMREHDEVDDLVRSGNATWTLLAPHLFLQNLLRAAEVVRRTGVLSAPVGHLEIPLIDTRDVGAAAAVVLGAPARHSGRTYPLTGPAAYTYASVAAAIAATIERPVRYEAVSPAEQEALLLAAGMPGWRAFDLAHIASAYDAADLAVTDEVPRLLGRAAGSLETFLADHRSAFRGE